MHNLNRFIGKCRNRHFSMHSRLFFCLAAFIALVSSGSTALAFLPAPPPQVPDDGPSLIVTVLTLAGVLVIGSRLRRQPSRA
jgi:hypothetical protein